MVISSCMMVKRFAGTSHPAIVQSGHGTVGMSEVAPWHGMAWRASPLQSGTVTRGKSVFFFWWYGLMCSFWAGEVIGALLSTCALRCVFSREFCDRLATLIVTLFDFGALPLSHGLLLDVSCREFLFSQARNEKVWSRFVRVVRSLERSLSLGFDVIWQPIHHSLIFVLYHQRCTQIA